MIENENIEFKEEYTPKIYKEIIAFVNTNGGTVYIGVDDNGNFIGLDSIDETYTKITNGIRDAIEPDVTLFVKYILHQEKIIEIQVNEGSSKPYFLKSKGLVPSGVYIRQGASSVQASYEQIKHMIRESDNYSFESSKSNDQELTFNYTTNIFKNHNIDFNETKYGLLGLKIKNNYTNLALLLSEQCKHSIKVAVFDNDSDIDFITSQELYGSILEQLNKALMYLDMCNKNHWEIIGYERLEHYDYPKEAIREAVINAIVHREYSFSGSTIININNKQIEIISLGGLESGLSINDIKNGISQLRNKNLADIFRRLNLIEAYGTGIKRIFDLYKDSGFEPSFNITENTFKIILPNMNYGKIFNKRR